MAPPVSCRSLLLAFLAASSSAAAQPLPDEDQRRGLIADAEAARDAGLHDQAVAHALRAGHLRWTPSLRMLVAEEFIALQRDVEAHEHATLCFVTAEADPGVRNRARIIAACRAIIALVEPQLGRLRLLLPDSPPAGLRLRVNGRELPRPHWRDPVLVMAGAAVIEADGEGVAVFRTAVQVFAGTQSELRMRFTEPPPPLPIAVDAGVRRPGPGPSSPR